MGLKFWLHNMVTILQKIKIQHFDKYGNKNISCFKSLAA
jgi:hypothetical protein